ncbi:hypothetical protein D3C71_1125080 [compost metagenome]
MGPQAVSGDAGVRVRAIVEVAICCALFPKYVHVMWLDGQGVSAPWPSPFVPRVRTDAHCRIDDPPRGEAVLSSLPTWRGVG